MKRFYIALLLLFWVGTGAALESENVLFKKESAKGGKLTVVLTTVENDNDLPEQALQIKKEVEKRGQKVTAINYILYRDKNGTKEVLLTQLEFREGAQLEHDKHLVYRILDADDSGEFPAMLYISPIRVELAIFKDKKLFIKPLLRNNPNNHPSIEKGTISCDPKTGIFTVQLINYPLTDPAFQIVFNYKVKWADDELVFEE